MRKRIPSSASTRLMMVLLFLAWTTGWTGTSLASLAQVTVVQLSDTHIGLSTAPHAAANLRQAVQMINSLHPDAVVVSGDIAEDAAGWQLARSILSGVVVPVFYAPGNHDVHTHNVSQYRAVFGPDYYRFDLHGITFIVIDSQLLGNFDSYDAATPPPLPADTAAESAKMIAWLTAQAASIPKGAVVVGIQHIPVFLDGGFPGSRPYWFINEPFRSKEMILLEKMGVKHMLVGHWHNYRVFSDGGITWHEGPATSWLPNGGELGFAVHTISLSGSVTSKFVVLPGATP